MSFFNKLGSNKNHTRTARPAPGNTAHRPARAIKRATCAVACALGIILALTPTSMPQALATSTQNLFTYISQLGPAAPAPVAVSDASSSSVDKIAKNVAANASNTPIDIALNIPSDYSGGSFLQVKQTLTDALVAQGFTKDQFNIVDTSTKIDTTDLSGWYVYDHYYNSTTYNNARNNAKNNTTRMPARWVVPNNSNPGSAEVDEAWGDGDISSTGVEYIQNVYNNGNNLNPSGCRAFDRHIYSYTSNVGGLTKANMIFAGYSCYAYSDFMFYPASSNSRKSVSFDLVSTAVNAHTDHGFGFLLNGGINTSGKLNGYVFYIEPKPAGNSTPTHFVWSVRKLTNADPSSSNLYSSATVVAGGAYTEDSNKNPQSGDFINLSQSKNARIYVEVTKSNLKVTYQQYTNANRTQFYESSPKDVVKMSLDNTGYNGFGPIVMYVGHNCGALTTVPYLNLEMSYSPTAFDAVNAATYRSDARKYFVNLATAAGDPQIPDEYVSNNANADYYDPLAKMYYDGVLYISNQQDSKISSNNTPASGNTKAHYGNGTANCNFHAAGDSFWTDVAAQIKQDAVDNRIYQVQHKAGGQEDPPPTSSPIANFYLSGQSGADINKTPLTEYHQQTNGAASADQAVYFNNLSKLNRNNDSLATFSYKVYGTKDEIVASADDVGIASIGTTKLQTFTNSTTEGVYTFELIVKDSAGNISGACQAKLPVYKDTTIPSISVKSEGFSKTAGVDGSADTTKNTLTFTMTDTGTHISSDGTKDNNGNGIAAYMITTATDASPNTPPNTKPAATDANWVSTGSSCVSKFTLSYDIPDGKSFTVWAKDHCGNIQSKQCHVCTVNFHKFDDYPTTTATDLVTTYVLADGSSGIGTLPDDDMYQVLNKSDNASPYTFVGWTDGATGSGGQTYAATNTVVTSKHTLDLYPKYTQNFVQVVFLALDHSSQFGTTEGKEYEQWGENGVITKNDDGTLTHSTDASATRIRFSVGDGAGIARFVNKHPDIIPTCVGYTFAGWKLSSNPGLGQGTANNAPSSSTPNQEIGSVLSTSGSAGEGTYYYLVPTWTINKHTIHINANGGVLRSNDSISNVDYQKAFSSYTSQNSNLVYGANNFIPTRIGCTFKGWTQFPAGGVSSRFMTESGVVNGSWPIMTDEDMTVYAVWERNTNEKFSVTLVTGDDAHTGLEGATTTATLGSATAAQTFYKSDGTHDDALTYGSAVASGQNSWETGLPTPTRAGWVFDGWYQLREYTDASGNPGFELGAEKITNETAIAWSQIADPSNDGVTWRRDHKLVAKWTPAADTHFTVEHYLQNIGAVGTGLDQSGSGYTNYTKATGEDISQYINLQGTTNEYVQFSAEENPPAPDTPDTIADGDDPSGDDPAGDDTDPDGDDTPTPGTADSPREIKAHTFEGFTYDPTLSASTYKVQVKDDGTAVIKLFYTRHQHNVTIDLNGHGVGSLTDAATAQQANVWYANTITNPGVPTEAGYTFGGWYTQNGTVSDASTWDDAYKWNFDTADGKAQTTMPDTDVTLYAKWMENEDVSLTFNVETQDTKGAVDTNAAHVGGTIRGTNPQALHPATGAATQVTAVAKPGYNFVEWRYKASSDTSGTGTKIEGATETLTTDLINSVAKETDAQQHQAYVPTTFYAAFKADANAKYTTKHYYQKADGTYPDDSSVMTEGRAETNSTVTGAPLTDSTTPKLEGGYSLYEGGNPDNVTSAEVAGDGSTVLKYYYKRNTYTVAFDNLGHGTKPENLDAVGFETLIKNPGDLTATGYNFDGWYTKNGSAAAAGTTPDWGDKWDFATMTMPGIETGATFNLYAKWTARDDTPYKVEHYKENATGTGYVLDKTENLVGTTDTTAQGAAQTYDHNTYDATVDGTKASGNINPVDENDADSRANMLTLKMYYPLNKHAVHFEANGHGTAPADIQNIKYGFTFAAPTAPTAAGYDFAGWFKEAACTTEWNFTTSTMPDENLTLYALWTPANGTPYTVESYRQDTTGKYQTTPFATVEKKDVTEATVTALASDITGFTYDAATTGAQNTGVVAGDGTTVLKLYYTRNQYTVHFEANGHGTAPADITGVYYDSKIREPEKPTSKGYKLSAWCTDEDLENVWTFGFNKMGAADMTLYALWMPNTSLTYSVEHYMQGLDGNYTNPAQTDTPSGKTYKMVTATPLSGDQIPGFEYDEENANNETTGYLSPDEDLVLKLYYKRLSYDLTFDLNGHGEDASTLPATRTVQYGATVAKPTEADPSELGLQFAGWYTDKKCVNRFYFEEDVADGGAFVGEQASTMPANGLTLYAGWEPFDGKKYEIKHYLQDLSGNYTETGVLPVEEHQAAIGSTVVANPRTNISGFEYDPTATGEVKSGQIPATGKLSLKLYYSRKSYTATFNTLGKCDAPAPQTVKFGGIVSEPSDLIAKGYRLEGWYTTDSFADGTNWTYSSSTMPAKDVTLYARFIPTGDTPYYVEYFKQNLDGTYNQTADETDKFIGNAGSNVAAPKKNFDGFEIDTKNTNAIAGANLQGDGSTVLRLYYSRMKFTVNFNENGRGVITPYQYYGVMYGAYITPPAVSNVNGFLFAGWYRDNAGITKFDFAKDTMAPAELTLYAKWIDLSKPIYKVQHFLQGLDGQYNGVPEDVDISSGDAGTAPIAQQKTYEGFTYDSQASALPQGTVIKEDGTLVINLLYTRNSYKCEFDANGHGVPPQTQMNVLYGAKVQEPQALTYPGYDFGGWYKDVNCVNKFDFATDTMGTANLKLYAKWTSQNSVRYKVEHYLQNVDGSTWPATASSQNYEAGEAGDVVVASPQTFEGFVLDVAKTGAQNSGNIAADGTTVLKVYYKRASYPVIYDMRGLGDQIANTTALYGATLSEPTPAPTSDMANFGGWYKGEACVNKFDFATETVPVGGITLYAKWVDKNATPYKVEHYKQQTDGTYPDTATETDVEGGVAGTMATAFSKTYDGFTYDATVEGTTTTGTIDASDPGLVLKLYYARNKYDVVFDANGHGTAPAPVSVRYQAKVPAGKQLSTPGYDFGGWYTTNVCADADAFDFANSSMGAATLKLYAKWTPKDDVSYTVSHYEQNVDGTYSDTAQVVTKGTATADSVVSVQPESFDGFTYAKGLDGEVLTSVIKGDGTTEFKIYYIRNKYTAYFNSNGHGANLPSAAGIRQGAYISKPDVPSVDGYEFDGWYREQACVNEFNFAEDTMPVGDITLFIKWKPVDGTPYTVKYFLSNLDGTYPAITPYGQVNAGKVGDSVEAAPRSFNGYTYDPNNTNEVKTATISSRGNTELRLYYKRNTYTVTFDANGHGTAPEAQKLPYGSPVVSPDPPVAEGFRFAGWYKDAGCTRRFHLLVDEVDSDVTLYAKWIGANEASYKVVHFLQRTDGTYAEAPTGWDSYTDVLSGEAGSLAIAYPNLFKGFTYKPSANEVNHVAIAADGSTVCKLYYERNTYTVSYNKNGHGDNQIAQTFKYGDKITYPSNLVANGADNVDWGGWYKELDCVNRWDKNVDTMPASNLELFCKWIDKSGKNFQVKHYLQKDDGTYSTTPDETDYDRAAEGTTVNGYPKTFDGYTYDSTIAGTVSSAKITAQGGEIRLYYSRDVHTVSYKLNGHGDAIANGSAKFGSHITAPEEPWDSNFAFGGWYTSVNCLDEEAWNFEEYPMLNRDVTLYAKWVPADVAYEIDTYLQGDDGSYPAAPSKVDYAYAGTGDVVSKSAPAIDGYDYDEANANNVTKITVPGALKFYYKVSAHDVTFNMNGHGKQIAGQFGVKTGQAVTKPSPDPTSAGFTFGGWFKEKDCTNEFDFDTEVMGGADLDLYAKWIDNNMPKYDTEYYLQKADGTWPTAASERVENAASAGTTVNAKVKTYSTFDLDAEHTGAVASGTVVDTSAGGDKLVLKLYYTRKKFDITFNMSGKGTQVDPVSVYYDGVCAADAAPADPTFAGYEFGGWYKTPEFKDADKFKFGEGGTKMPKGGITVFAKWDISKSNYDIQYRVNSGQKDPSGVGFGYNALSKLTRTLEGDTNTMISIDATDSELVPGEVQDTRGNKFWFNAEKSAATMSGINKGTPKLILKLYYDRYLKVEGIVNGAGGKVDSLTDVKEGTSPTVNITPDNGMVISSVKVDGNVRDDLIAVGKVTFNDNDVVPTATGIHANHKVEVSFAKKTQDVTPPSPTPGPVAYNTMYRLYNPNSGEHFYTSSAKEKKFLMSGGWNDEGVGWYAPKKSNTYVYRLLNPSNNDHHYTPKKKERDAMVKNGWIEEKGGFYSDDAKGVPLYREFNPNATFATHNYTRNLKEHKFLTTQGGWKNENIAWYGVKVK